MRISKSLEHGTGTAEDKPLHKSNVIFDIDICTITVSYFQPDVSLLRKYFWEGKNQTPFSPDFTPSDFNLF
jgi:hypothetical protein